MDLDVKVFRKMVRDVATSTSKKFPEYVDPLDVEQELWLWLYSQKDWLIKQIEGNVVPAKLSGVMHSVAVDFCEKERAAVECHDVSASFTYSVEDLKNLLPDVFEGVEWSGDHSRITEVADIKLGMSKLNEAQNNVLVWKYRFQFTDDNVADELGITQDAAKKRHQRALNSLQRALGYKEAPVPVEAA